ncbi:hypothetical protein OKW40_000683 [Paraburkholderia sp. RAU6.4a]|uniref:hypothetical protein n=1 Tax=Paraburkholderia sp. RAU6.4a TaxID=2991067 RepID=UPI003D20B78B
MRTPADPAHLHLEKHRRSLALHRLIAEKIRRDPTLFDRARENLDRWMATGPVPARGTLPQ